MDSNSNNFSDISISMQQEDLDLSDFSTLSAEEMDSNKELESKLAKDEQQAIETGGSSMMEMKWQFVEKFGELKKEVEKMGRENEKMKKEFAEKIAVIEGKVNENDRQMRELNDDKAKLGRENEELKGDLAEKGRAMAEMTEENRKLKEKIDGINKQKAESEAIKIVLMSEFDGGKSPAYAFKVIPGQPMSRVSFPSDATTGSDIPKGMKRIGDLPHGDVVCALTIAKDGQRVFTGGKGTVKLWNIGDRIGGAKNWVDGDSAASAKPLISMKTYPCLIEKDSLKECYTRSCKLFPDCSTLVVGGETNTICVLDVEKGEMKMELDCDAEACYALALSQDSRLCFCCCSSGAVLVWDLQSGERIASLEGHTEGVSCGDLSVDGQRLWTGGLDNTVRCWDIGARTQMDKMELDSQIFSLGCCPSDDWVAVGMKDQNVQVLNTNGSGEKFLLQNHQSCVLSVKFAHSGKWFVSTGKDNVANCWRSPYGYRLARSKEASSVLCCDISADDRFLLTGSGDKKASLYQLTF